MPYVAKHRFADMTPQKMRPFADLIRGRNVDDAIEQLRFYPNRGARLIEKVLKSAIGNAEDRGCQDIENLIVTEARIDGGPMFKRIRPRARGTAFQILRRLAHIVIAVDEAPEGDDFDTAPAPAAVTASDAVAPVPMPVEAPVEEATTAEAPTAPAEEPTSEEAPADEPSVDGDKPAGQ